MSTLAGRAPAASPGLADYTGRATKAASQSHGSLMTRFRAYLAERRRKRTDRAIELLVQGHGGVMSDDLERAISRQLGAMVGPR